MRVTRSQQPDDDKGGGRVCRQCKSREKNCTGIQECKMCWQRILGIRRFDGVAVDQTNQVIYTYEFKTTTDREHGNHMGAYNNVMKERQSSMQIFCKLSEEL